MSNYKFNTFGFNFDDLGKAVDDFIHNVKVNDIFGTDVRSTVPAVNSLEYTDYLELQLAAPGLNKEDFELHIEHNQLSVSTKKQEKAKEEEEAKVLRKEFNYTAFKRTFQLTDKFDYNNIKAKYEAGILQIIIPKKSKDQTSKIKVDVL